MSALPQMTLKCDVFDIKITAQKTLLVLVAALSYLLAKLSQIRFASSRDS